MYVDGVLHTMLIDKDDMVLFDGLKHHITLYEEDLSKEFFEETTNELSN
jgi:hypothetical protein